MVLSMAMPESYQPKTALKSAPSKTIIYKQVNCTITESSKIEYEAIQETKMNNNKSNKS